MTDHNKRTFDQPIPRGWGTYTRTFKVSGIHHRIKDVRVALENNQDPHIFLEPEPENEHDKKAIAIYIKKKVLFWNSNIHIGYVPAPFAAIIHKHQIQDFVRIRIRILFEYESGGMAVICDLIGPQDSAIYTNRVGQDFDDCEI